MNSGTGLLRTAVPVLTLAGAGEQSRRHRLAVVGLEDPDRHFGRCVQQFVELTVELHESQ